MFKAGRSNLFHRPFRLLFTFSPGSAPLVLEYRRACLSAARPYCKAECYPGQHLGLRRRRGQDRLSASIGTQNRIGSEIRNRQSPRFILHQGQVCGPGVGTRFVAF